MWSRELIIIGRTGTADLAAHDENTAECLSQAHLADEFH